MAVKTAYEKCQLWYVEKKLWSKSMVTVLLNKGKITQEEYDLLVAAREASDAEENA